MQKLLSAFILFMLTLTAGCSSDMIGFSGESDSWKGEYSAVKSDTNEHGEYRFTYKHAARDTSFKNLTIMIHNGETVRQEDFFKGATIVISIAGSGSGLTRESDPIPVTIKWDEDQEESFTMKPR
ncbi:hypothetical protein [Pseudobacillus wudalianchiensis]|uniref:Lipoprotein n=1 Tax=Pseudobacillus wudalianchiensis TaxID=1743143 RepID=A0A1B9ADT2_9BACI|nr:hypothetical protein [Bacillus wudalianchiensis]OCA81961.1 hypothetical protein A8F95_14695 [Bacillus wudalianchiensis]